MESVEKLLMEVSIEDLIKQTQNTKDRCVLCHEETEYDINDPVKIRKGYTDAGQLCPDCYINIYSQ